MNHDPKTPRAAGLRRTVLRLAAPAAAAIAIALAGFGMPVPRAAGQTDADMAASVDAYVRDHMRRLNIPGMAVGVVRGTTLVHVQGYGVTGPDGRAVTGQTPFHIASISKSITAASVLRLVESGQVDLDAPVQRYLPWFTLADAGAAARITVRHLLHHTSGLSEFDGDVRNLDPDLSAGALERSVRRLRDARLASQPGARHEYSNTNYDILGAILEAVAGVPFGELVRNTVFTPLKMPGSHAALDEARGSGASSGHYPLLGVPWVVDGHIPLSRASQPSAGLVSSAEGLSRWLAMFLGGGRLDGVAFLSSASVATLITPDPSRQERVRYAMGWVTFPFDGIPSGPGAADSAPLGISHGGAWLGFLSLVVMVPARDLGVVVLMNAHDPTASSDFYDAGWNIARIALGVPTQDNSGQEEWWWRNTRPVGAVVLAITIGLNILIVRRARRMAVVIGAAAVQVVIALAMAVVRLRPDPGGALALTWAFTPDIAVLYGLVVAVAAWAVALAAARATKARTRTP